MAATAAHYTPKTRIYLSGSLARKFFRFKDYQLDSGCANECFKALKNTIDGFNEEITRLGRLGVRFAIFRNRKNVSADGFGLGGSRELRIVPIIQGAKRAGALQTVLGVVLIIASFFVAPGSQAAFMAAGIGSTAGGVIQMLSPQTSGLKQSASAENLPSYAFGSAKNTTASGNPVPICIGERRWGGAIISAGIYAEDKA
ncbi:tail assembly protein [Pseudomonas cannabina]|uniref:Tail assembly protein n=4 Tax=Pseudomonas syringae group TaxID=136849 RepID=A0A8T8C8B1_PSEYM|nr:MULTISPECIES: tail assembly protein [Pseudomonas syringae group]KPB75136.1 Bacteriophage lambda tail assembly I [Pseudomonas syringae pv. maculicola]MBM0142501.1 tail assembly protein [Pseudomonas cannabina pv. alisalensis]QHE98328.1 tail assembly protein [Pseudomonas syringae pv. maculicola str. ES4326]QHE99778.1 tail assembly protein [Pseudomonas syringae pv. maculicola str. ES4326]QQN21813.1 tail assembly protein [Pseudomonas cannabina pv. alisalensis]